MTRAATPTPTFSIAVYCGAREGANAQHAQAARAVGDWIGRHGGQLVYGGGNSGLMGVVAQATHAAGGRVLGVIPQALVERELANHDCDELHVVTNMHQRKALMAEQAQAFCALPGGIGTLEELFEVWTWRQLGYHDKPVGLLNVDGYYNDLLNFLKRMVPSGFLSGAQRALMLDDDNVDTLMRQLVQAAGLPVIAFDANRI
jgi:uncharacterized protein (TIGR00730 family)